METVFKKQDKGKVCVGSVVVVFHLFKDRMLKSKSCVHYCVD